MTNQDWLDEILHELVQDAQNDVSDFKLSTTPHELVEDSGAKQSILSYIDEHYVSPAQLGEIKRRARAEELQRLWQQILSEITLGGSNWLNAIEDRIQKRIAELSKEQS